MLLIITPNPALDRTMVFRGLRLGAVQRTDEVLVAAGGKGLNVARAARTLGAQVLVCAPLGGLTGEQVSRLAAQEGITGRWTPRSGETRTCILLVDPEAADATALNESGSPLAPADWAAFTTAVLAAAPSARLCLISGSLPPGVPPERLGELVGKLGAAGARVLADTSGAALASVLAAAPWGVKVNGAEIGAVLGREVADVAGAVAAVGELRRRGVVLAAVSLGAQGCVAADASGCWWASPPPVQVISTVGSGDSLLAGLAVGLLDGLPLADALGLGVACGTADALTVGGGRIDPATVAQLRMQVRLTT